MNKKYELLEREANGLCRIKALRDFRDVKTGDIGGYVETEENLSHYGECWIYDNAKVYNNASIYDDAKVYDNARIYNNVKAYNNVEVCMGAKVYGDAKSIWCMLDR